MEDIKKLWIETEQEVIKNIENTEIPAYVAFARKSRCGSSS